MVLLRALAVWVVLLLVESAHGIFRRLVLELWTSDFFARQISVFTGSVLILIVTYFFVDWIGAKTAKELTVVGVMWVLLTFGFEVGLGRFILHYSWDRVFADFNLAAGGLLGIGLLIMGLAPRMTSSIRRVKPSAFECARPLPGDGRITQPAGTLTHAITIQCSRRDLWPWLAQMGAGRAGWYSYDFLDNGRQQSADRILPQLQQISIGTLFPGVPGAADAFFVLAYQAGRFLVLGAGGRDGVPGVTWTFVLEDAGTGMTRMIVRVRAGAGYTFHGLPFWIVRLIHYIMQRKQLLELARRAERWTHAGAVIVSPSSPAR